MLLVGFPELMPRIEIMCDCMADIPVHANFHTWKGRVLGISRAKSTLELLVFDCLLRWQCCARNEFGIGIADITASNCQLY